MNEWIKCSERLPKDDQTVLCYQLGRTAALPIIAWYDEDLKAFQVAFTWQEILIHPTHWMPLPNCPEPPRDNE